jgi:hypothetical protein
MPGAMSRLRDRLTYANVVSTLALLIALGAGSAFAANQLAPRSVGERQLRPGAVTADKIRKNAVTAPKIKAEAVKQGKIAGGAVSGEKIAGGAVTTPKIANGAIGPEKIPDGSITGAKVDEASLGQVPSAGTAGFATTAGSAGPEAFARVDGEGTVFPASAKGIGTSDVKQGNMPGIYCIAVPGFVPRGAQATPEYAASSDVSVFVKFGGTESCGPTQIEIRVYNGGSLQKGPFHVMFYR